MTKIDNDLLATLMEKGVTKEDLDFVINAVNYTNYPGKVDQKKRKKIIELAKQGYLVEDIKDMTKVSRVTIKKIINEEGIDPDKERLKRIIKVFRALRSLGFTKKEIHKITGFSEVTVRKYLKLAQEE